MKRHILFIVALLSLVGRPFSTTTPATLLSRNDYLQVVIVTGEHSRDSNSTTRTLTVASGELTYEETYSGARSGQRQPIKKQFKLSKQDQSDLTALLKAEKLLVTRTISQPSAQKGFSRYFQITITSTNDGKQSSVAIEAPPSAENLRTDPLYQGAVRLIEQLYRLMNRTDPEMAAPTLIG